jgi:hypothetical protein
LETYKDFAIEHRRIRESFDPLLKLHEVRKILDCGRGFVLKLIEDGELEAVNMTPGRAHDEGNGIRITPASLRDYLDRHTVR